MDICKLIIEEGVEANPTADNGCTPLHLATQEGHLDICKLICTNIDKKNPEYNSK